ncbi:MAG: CRISPR-associated helicase/endonuclease Cas3, partial [Acetanaerobacterium sp.]
RTRVIKRGVLDTATLAAELNTKRQALCIVNTRKHALNLYERLATEGSFHLSTLMCPIHRNSVIDEMRARLKAGLPCRVVSTRLIEAGVDVDFPTVYRSVCGLDSIIQSAGRCNREGRLTDAEGKPVLGEVHTFEPEAEYSKHQPAAFGRPIAIARGVMRRHEDILSPQAISEYFTELYELEGDALDEKKIFSELERSFDPKHGELNFDFATVADEFRLIENDTRAIIIPYDDKAKEKIKELRRLEQVGDCLRALQKYTVTVYEPEFQGLLGTGNLETVPHTEIHILRENSNLYDDRTGLTLVRKSGNGIYI